MRKALIPTVFVLAGVVATNLWSRVKLPCETLQIDMARAVMSQLLTSAVDELLTANRCSGVVSSASRLVVKVAAPRDDFASFLNGSRIRVARLWCSRCWQ